MAQLYDLTYLGGIGIITQYSGALRILPFPAMISLLVKVVKAISMIFQSKKGNKWQVWWMDAREV